MYAAVWVELLLNKLQHFTEKLIQQLFIYNSYKVSPRDYIALNGDNYACR